MERTLDFVAAHEDEPEMVEIVISQLRKLTHPALMPDFRKVYHDAMQRHCLN